MAEQVLNAAQLLTALRREPGYERITANLYGSRISALSMAIVLAECGRAGLDVEQCRIVIAKLNLRIVPLDENQASSMALAMLQPGNDEIDLETLASRTIKPK